MQHYNYSNRVVVYYIQEEVLLSSQLSIPLNDRHDKRCSWCKCLIIIITQYSQAIISTVTETAAITGTRLPTIVITITVTAAATVATAEDRLWCQCRDYHYYYYYYYYICPSWLLARQGEWREAGELGCVFGNGKQRIHSNKEVIKNLKPQRNSYIIDLPNKFVVIAAKAFGGSGGGSPPYY